MMMISMSRTATVRNSEMKSRPDIFGIRMSTRAMLISGSLAMRFKPASPSAASTQS